MNQYLDAQTVEMFSDEDCYRQPLFCDVKSEMGGSPYQGWVNAATWCFNLYFFQESKLIEALRNLVRKDGTINPGRALKLFSWTSGIRIDKDCEGNVYTPEIIEFFLKQYGK